MKKIYLLVVAILYIGILSAHEIDSLKSVDIEEIVVRSSKETNPYKKVPAAISVINSKKISNRGIESIKDISTLVPNLFIPNYGSRMSTPIYLRGLGSRSSSQLVGVYVDNVPYMDMSSFDFALNDIENIEVLRGPQGTLYGRNAMGGIINIYTKSPLDYQGLKFSAGIGNYGAQQYKISNYSKLTKDLAVSVGGYYTKRDGYFTNEFTDEKADYEKSAGANIRLDWKISNRWKAKLSSSFDYVNQGAFPYAIYDKTNDVILPVNYNDEGSYLRRMSNNNLNFEYRADKFLLTSNTGYQFLDDDMWMDQDYTPASIFTINQRKTQNSLSQEIALRSLKTSNYQWSVGAFGFYDDITNYADVNFLEDFSALMPNMPAMTGVNPGKYDTPNYGLAVFHQSTINNLLTEGLSLTLGARVDYEKQQLDYLAGMEMDIPPMPNPVKDEITGKLNQDFIQFLPKLSLKYECTDDIMTYATVSKGYKTGGYNVQMFAEIMQNRLMTILQGKEATISDLYKSVSYSPEISWNYELGTRAEFADGRFKSELALFYMDVKDLQLTQFAETGTGRVLTNAGHGRSIGLELSMFVQPINNLSLDANYGYTNAKFKSYYDGITDFKGNYIPYTPQNTFAVGATYAISTNCNFIKQILLNGSYNGSGKMYWNEENTSVQDFYGTINAKIALIHKNVKLELWAKNIADTEYSAFYFESFGNTFLQRGMPHTYGATLTFSIFE